MPPISRYPCAGCSGWNESVLRGDKKRFGNFRGEDSIFMLGRGGVDHVSSSFAELSASRFFSSNALEFQAPATTGDC